MPDMENGSQFKTVALVGRPDTPGIDAPLLALAKRLESFHCEVLFEAETARDIGPIPYPAASVADIGQRADLAIVLGGDGTLLGIGRQLAPYGTPLIGINHGRLGFITDIGRDEIYDVVPAMLAGQYTREERMLLEAGIVRDAQELCHALAFNDVVVNRSGFSGMVELRVAVDGRFMYNQRSDGLIVATPTGSTAYALAAQGPILQPGLRGIVLVPIAPHALSNRPIVVEDSARIEIRFVSGREVNVNFDMQSFTALEPGDTIVVQRSKHRVSLLHPHGWNYFSTLRKKLHWNEYPSEEDR